MAVRLPLSSSAICVRQLKPSAVRQRAFEYWRKIDKSLGDKVEAGVQAKQGERDPKAAGQGNPARSSMQEEA